MFAHDRVRIWNHQLIRYAGYETADGVIMAVRAKNMPVYGLQFHPESVFTPKGKRVLKNFVEVICYENR